MKELGWYEVPPVTGWYASAKIYNGEIECMGIELFSKTRIKYAVAQKNILYFGPIKLPNDITQ